MAAPSAARSSGSPTRGARRRHLPTSRSGSPRPAPRRSCSFTPRPRRASSSTSRRSARPAAPPGRSSSSTLSRASAQCPLETDAVGRRRRRHRVAEGADDPARALASRPSRRRPGSGASERLAALLFGLGARHAPQAGGPRHAVHPRGLDSGRPRRRARAAARGRARGRLRAARRARPRLPRGREGDGPRALLAGRRALGRRHRDPHPRRRRRRASWCSRCATATASRSRAGTATSCDRLFRIGHIGWVDVFDITTALAAVELELVDMGAPIERGVAVAARARGVRATSVVTRGRSSSASRSPTPVSRCCGALRGRRRRRVGPRGDHRRLRRDRRSARRRSSPPS